MMLFMRWMAKNSLETVCLWSIAKEAEIAGLFSLLDATCMKYTYSVKMVKIALVALINRGLTSLFVPLIW